MSYFNSPVGAWLSGGSNESAALHPNDGSRPAKLSAGWHPNDQYSPVNQSAGWHPNDRPNPARPSADWHPNDSALQREPVDSRTASPWPWAGVDPSWVYANGSALLGQALRKSRAKVIQPADAKSFKPANHGVALWRWQSPYRVHAVVSELSARVIAQHRALWLLDPIAIAIGGTQPQAVALRRVFALDFGPGDLRYEVQIDKVLRAAVEREDRLPEILSQASDFWPFFESITGISRAAAPITSELLDVAQAWALYLTMGLKHQMQARRPVELSALVMPVIPTPGHGSLPSGHATVAAMLSELLVNLVYTSNLRRGEQLDRLARRVAFNRVVAGVHFPVDSLAGYSLGTQLARLLVAMAGKGKCPKPIVGDAALRGKELKEIGSRPVVQSDGAPVAPALLLVEMWKKATDELAELGI